MAEKTRYSIAELAAAADSLFKTRGLVATAALRAAKKEAYTEKEAKEIVSKFIMKEVK